MTGRELIENIKKYNLEDYDFPICGEDGVFPGYISIEEVYRNYRVPISYIRNTVREHDIKLVNVLNKELMKEEDAQTYFANYEFIRKKNRGKTFRFGKERAKA